MSHQLTGIQEFLYEICIPAIVILCVLAALFNILIFVSRFYVKTRSSSLELTYSLALSDTWTSTIIAGSLFWNSYKPVVLGIRHESFCFPLTMEAFRTGGLLTGCFHLAALGFVHYLTIVRPFDHVKFMNIRLTQTLIIIIWSVPPLLLIVYFSSHANQGYRNERCMGASFYEALYFRAFVSLVIIVLIMITCALYWNMLRKISSVRTKTGTANPRGRRTVVTAVLIFGTFLIGWLPASIMFILTAKGMPLHGNSSIIVNILSIVVLVNIMGKTLTNPIIYATRIPEIRQFVLQRVFWQIRTQSVVSRRSELTPLKKSSGNCN
ncbi:unnamed protein product, partial [Mesorhabditis belari]|uniref:G-protein coupled receptors family 1 profile domain-containing protein n=1 Tax=Mesorhabditis belari TaxID=2138241 RepID=A0AAF3F4R2_9BILA